MLWFRHFRWYAKGYVTASVGGIRLQEPGLQLSFHQLFQVLMPDLLLMVHVERALASV